MAAQTLQSGMPGVRRGATQTHTTYAAIKSGGLAAKTILNGMQSGDLSFASYTQQIRQEFTRDYGYGYNLGNIFYRFPIPLLRVYAQAKPLHLFTEEIMNADMDYQGLVLKGLSQAPRYLFRKATQRFAN